MNPKRRLIAERKDIMSQEVVQLDMMDEKGLSGETGKGRR